VNVDDSGGGARSPDAVDGDLQTRACGMGSPLASSTTVPVTARGSSVLGPGAVGGESGVVLLSLLLSPLLSLPPSVPAESSRGADGDVVPSSETASIAWDLGDPDRNRSQAPVPTSASSTSSRTVVIVVRIRFAAARLQSRVTDGS
jgi:hypothetical protein